VEKKVIAELQTSAATPLVNAMRMLRLQKAVLAIGMFSLFESLLQEAMGWKNPFSELEGYLKARQKAELAKSIGDYVLAINALKHGEGRSYRALLEKRTDLEFAVRPEDNSEYFDVGILIDVNETFVRRCASLIQEAAAVIRKNEKVTIV